MLFNYQVLTKEGGKREGQIDAINVDVAIKSLQRRGFTVASVDLAQKPGLFANVVLFEHIPNKDIVILSRQIAVLFGSDVSALRVFKMLGAELENLALRKVLTQVADDIQGGATISSAMAKHPKVFSDFYVNMVRAGEESGKLSETFFYLADYLDRNYELMTKTRNAFIYPAFVIFTFITVMVLMLTLVIPKLSAILSESGQDVPVYTKVVIGFSNFLVQYGIFLLAALVAAGLWLWRWRLTSTGKIAWGHFLLELPVMGALMKKLYLSRIADNMYTMLSSGIPMVRALEITGTVVENAVYEQILSEATEAVRGGLSLSRAFEKYDEIPNIMIQIMRVGEETGELGTILKTLSDFYKREVDNAIDTMVDLIEPVMIVMLGGGVGFLLASVLIPIYNLSNAI